MGLGADLEGMEIIAPPPSFDPRTVEPVEDLSTDYTIVRSNSP